MKSNNRSKRYNPQVLKQLHQIQLQMLEDFIRVCEKRKLSYFVVYGTAIGAVRHQGFIPWDDDIDVGMLREDYNKLLKVFDDELGERYDLLTSEIDGRYACTVTHIQRKGTKFISEMSQDLKCEQCIFMDIFPFDYVAKEKKRQLMQMIKTIFWGKLLFLAGTGRPFIAVGGFLGGLAKFICRIIHVLLVLFRISPRYLYGKFVKAATQFNHSELKGEYVTSFEYAGCLKDKVRVKDIFPLKNVKFEYLEVKIPKNNHIFLEKIYGNYMKLPSKDKRINHMPLVIDFGDALDGINLR